MHLGLRVNALRATLDPKPMGRPHPPQHSFMHYTRPHREWQLSVSCSAPVVWIAQPRLAFAGDSTHEAHRPLSMQRGWRCFGHRSSRSRSVPACMPDRTVHTNPPTPRAPGRTAVPDLTWVHPVLTHPITPYSPAGGQAGAHHPHRFEHDRTQARQASIDGRRTGWRVSTTRTPECAATPGLTQYLLVTSITSQIMCFWQEDRLVRNDHTETSLTWLKCNNLTLRQVCTPNSHRPDLGAGGQAGAHQPHRPLGAQ